MDFEIPADVRAKLAELDAFIDAEFAPLEREHIQFCDHRREHARIPGGCRDRDLDLAEVRGPLPAPGRPGGLPGADYR
jgi:hypothetical protein